MEIDFRFVLHGVHFDMKAWVAIGYFDPGKILSRVLRR